MKKRYYIAYGSNLNVEQMAFRCPHATILGTAALKGWELLFKGSKTGSYLTIEERNGGSVPVVIWEVTESDEAALDRYEGFPSFAYLMYENRPIGIPSNFYMRTCLEGYDAFFFDRKVLAAAYDKCREAVENEG